LPSYLPQEHYSKSLLVSPNRISEQLAIHLLPHFFQPFTQPASQGSLSFSYSKLTVFDNFIIFAIKVIYFYALEELTIELGQRSFLSHFSICPFFSPL
jgi:hypothetical protein